MPPKKSPTAKEAAAAQPVGPISRAAPPKSKLPGVVRFPLVVVLNLSLSALLYSVTSEITTGDLAEVSRTYNEWWQVTGLVVWKALELAVGWWGQYDGYDLAALTFLSHLPTLHLLTSFYTIRPTTVIVSLLIDVTATYLPFRLLRRVLPPHASDAPKSQVANKNTINDYQVQVLVVVLGAAVYAISVFGSFTTWLPTYLVVHFDGLRDLTGVYSAQFQRIVLSSIPIGFATKTFLFTPAAGTPPDAADLQVAAFTPQTATLMETVRYNFWGFSARQRALYRRTAVLATVTLIHTWLQVYITVEGAEGYGAFGWALVWATGAALTGTLYSWIMSDTVEYIVEDEVVVH